MDNLVTASSNWAIAADGIQWVLQRRYGGQLRAVGFVHSSRAILARCMSEAGVSTNTAHELLKDLPPTFNEWAPGGGRSVLETFSS